MKKSCNHLPIFGVGPYYGAVVIGLTLIGILLSVFHVLDTGLITIYWLKMTLSILGFIVIIFGFVVWFKAAIGVKNIDYYIKENKLCTTGIYSVCRNPCYSGIMLMCDGAILIAHNYWLFILPFIFWIGMTILMKNTEEKWLLEKYGEEYSNYAKKTNRCFPWFRKQK